MKKCSKCGIEKELTEFHKRKRSKDGRVSTCKVCRSELSKRYNSNPEIVQKRKKQQAEYRSRPETIDKSKKQQKKWYESNKKRVLEKQKQYRIENKDKIAKRMKEYNYRPEVKERNKKRQKEYLARPETIEMRKEYFARPEVKERIQKRRIEYESRPEIKEMREKYQTEYREENKDKIRVRQVKYYHKKGSKLKSFIYQIKNLKNNRIYIGETIRGKERIQKHFSCLRSQRHENYKLQQDFNEHGEEAFEWSIIKEFPKDKKTLLLEEAREIQRRINNGENLYNLMLTIEQLKMLNENQEKK